MGLHPIEAVKGWHKHIGDGMSLDAILAEGEVLNLCGQPPGKHALWSAIRRVKQMSHADLLPTSNYAKCGRKQILSNAQQQSIVQFVKAWRHKRFCTARYIREELRLKASQRTICRVLNAHGYHWKPVPRIEGFSKLQLSKRKAFVDKYISRPVSWWQAHMSMVLDGVTLTMAHFRMAPDREGFREEIRPVVKRFYIWLKVGASNFMTTGLNRRELTWSLKIHGPDILYLPSEARDTRRR